MTRVDLPRLQQFFDDNPDYFRNAYGAEPQPGLAASEMDDAPPPELPFEQRWVVGLFSNAGDLCGMATLWRNFIAEQVWLISLFMIARDQYGSGLAQNFYLHLERWMLNREARWIRLGVIEGSTRAERFWAQHGYTEVRRRIDTSHCPASQNIRVLVKSLKNNPLNEYLKLIVRDQPESP